MKSRIVVNLVSRQTLCSNWFDTNVEKLRDSFLESIKSESVSFVEIPYGEGSRYVLIAALTDFYFETNEPE